jgi:hypothetical protein
MKRFLLLVMLTLLPCSTVFAEDWSKINEEDGIKVFKKEVKGSSLVAFKGDGIIDAPIRVVLGVIVDNAHRTEWVDRLKTSTILHQYSSYDFVVYQHFGLPVLMSDRDYVYRATGYTTAKGQVVVEMSSVEHKNAPASVGVRAKLVNSRYVLTPVGKNELKTRISVEIQTDPKGWLPAWLVNTIQKSWPLKTLRGIRGQVKKPHSRAYVLPPKKKGPGKKPAKKAPAKVAAKKPAKK